MVRFSWVQLLWQSTCTVLDCVSCRTCCTKNNTAFTSSVNDWSTWYKRKSLRTGTWPLCDLSVCACAPRTVSERRARGARCSGPSLTIFEGAFSLRWLLTSFLHRTMKLWRRWETICSRICHHCPVGVTLAYTFCRLSSFVWLPCGPSIWPSRPLCGQWRLVFRTPILRWTKTNDDSTQKRTWRETNPYRYPSVRYFCSLGVTDRLRVVASRQSHAIDELNDGPNTSWEPLKRVEGEVKATPLSSRPTSSILLSQRGQSTGLLPGYRNGQVFTGESPVSCLAPPAIA